MRSYIHYVWVEEDGRCFHYRLDSDNCDSVEYFAPKHEEWVASSYENLSELKRSAREEGARLRKVDF